MDFSDLTARRRIYELFDTSFPRLSERIRIAETAGARWHEVSTPFVEFAGGRAVAHAAVIAIPMVLGGRPRAVAGVHAVCTRPEFRGRGHSRTVLEQALDHVDRHFDLALLTTEIPALYERFGFRVVPEHVFEIAAPAGRAGPRPRRLSIRRPEDVDVVHRILATRAPTSNVLCATDPGWLFIIDEVLTCWGFARLHHLEDLDAIAAYELSRGTLRLLDIAAATLPRLDAVLERIPEPFHRVELWFTPDRVWHGPVRTRATPPGDYLMFRGDFRPERELILPPLARC